MLCSDPLLACDIAETSCNTGGIGAEAGTVVVATEGVNGLLEPVYSLPILGGEIAHNLAWTRLESPLPISPLPLLPPLLDR